MANRSNISLPFNPPTKTPFLAHIVGKSGPSMADLGGDHPPPTGLNAHVIA